jgi:DinB family protein
MTTPLLRAIIAHMDSVFQGPNGDYPAVLEALEGISVSQALWKPSPTQNSIWQIVEHLVSSKQWQIDALHNAHPASPPWVEPAGDEVAWHAAVSRLKEMHQQLKLTLEGIAESDLLEVPAGESGSTLLELILSSGSAHEAHHSGQIDYLKGLQS